MILAFGSGIAIQLLDEVLEEVQEAIVMGLEVCCQVFGRLVCKLHLCGDERALIDIPVYMPEFQQFFYTETY